MYVTLENLNKSFRNNRVVKGLSLGLAQGEILCVLGASGCGKTTTLKMVGGFLTPDAGRILLDGEDITKLPPERRPVSTVFQSYALFPNMTVLQNVTYGLKFKKVKRKEASDLGKEYLSMVGLSEYGDVRIYELSGGQQQRVALARALIVHPKLLLLDEPLSNLDAKLRLRMRDEIREIRQRFDVTMIFVTHDQEEAMSIADRIAIMKEGRLLQVGSPEEIYNYPADEYVMRFLGLANCMELPGSPQGSRPLYVRPEDLMVDERGTIVGTVRKREYLGFYTQYEVETACGILTLRTMEDKYRQPGEEIRLSIREKRSLL